LLVIAVLIKHIQWLWLSILVRLPAHMWKHTIRESLEVLRHRRPESQEYMLAFFYLAYRIYAYFSRQCLDLLTHGSSALVTLHATAWSSKRFERYRCISFHHAYQTSRQQSHIAAVSDKEDQVSRGGYFSPFCETTGDRVAAARCRRRSIHPSGRLLLDIVRSDCIDA
jgi:hypothetical protein